MTIHFDSSISKINADGNAVLSSTLDKGEKLASGQTYADVKKNGVASALTTVTVETDTMTTDETVTHTVGGSTKVEAQTTTNAKD